MGVGLPSWAAFRQSKCGGYPAWERTIPCVASNVAVATSDESHTGGTARLNYLDPISPRPEMRSLHPRYDIIPPEDEITAPSV